MLGQSSIKTDAKQQNSADATRRDLKQNRAYYHKGADSVDSDFAASGTGQRRWNLSLHKARQ